MLPTSLFRVLNFTAAHQPGVYTAGVRSPGLKSCDKWSDNCYIIRLTILLCPLNIVKRHEKMRKKPVRKFHIICAEFHQWHLRRAVHRQIQRMTRKTELLFVNTKFKCRTYNQCYLTEHLECQRQICEKNNPLGIHRISNQDLLARGSCCKTNNAGLICPKTENTEFTEPNWGEFHHAMLSRKVQAVKISGFQGLVMMSSVAYLILNSHRSL